MAIEDLNLPINEPVDAGRVEVLQSSSIINNMFDLYILQHEFTIGKPELLASAEELSTKLGEFYQLINNV